MESMFKFRRAVIVAVTALSLAAVVAGPAAAKPKPAFAPKVGEFSGDSIAEGKSHSVFALVKSKRAVEVEIAFPAKCQTGTGPVVPTELLYKVVAQIKGHAISFKGQSVDLMKIVGFGAPSEVTLSGKFTGPSAFTANATVKAPAPGAETETHCSVPGAKLKFNFSLAA
jgi:hypothetical protein